MFCNTNNTQMKSKLKFTVPYRKFIQIYKFIFTHFSVQITKLNYNKRDK